MTKKPDSPRLNVALFIKMELEKEIGLKNLSSLSVEAHVFQFSIHSMQFVLDMEQMACMRWNLADKEDVWVDFASQKIETHMRKKIVEKMKELGGE